MPIATLPAYFPAYPLGKSKENCAALKIFIRSAALKKFYAQLRIEKKQ